ncbi:MAG: PAS domain S-box protein [Gloeocapsa sp. UFS-A4-WI-NPMV-4B04]|jgi:PAS domain S-box-containing protein|nr:PAS domain S-box protein [Gloeocapsa sp. UFS-A4-WI-NPMV-4B04]
MSYLSGLSKKRFSLRRYSIAVFTVAIALLVNLLLSLAIEQEESSFLLFFAAILVSARYGGMRSGFLATALATIGNDYFFIYPFNSFTVDSFSKILSLVLFVLEGLLVSKVVASLNSAKHHAELCKQEALHHQATLRQSEERFRLLVEDVKDYAIFMLAPNGNVVSWNEGGERIFGYQEAEIIGEHGSCLFTPEDVRNSQHKQEMITAEAVGRADDERWHLCKDGTTFWASGVLTALRDEAGNLRGFTKVVRDMTERKLTEDALRESEARLKFVLNSSKIGDWDVFLTEPYTAHRSLKHDQIFGYESPVADWNFEIFLQHVHPDDREYVELKFKRTLATHEKWNFECRIIWPDQSIHWIWVRGSVYHDIKDKPIRLMGIIKDISERKQAEAALKQANADLAASEERLRLALEAAQMSTWEWDILADKVNWSNNSQLLSDLNPSGYLGSYQAFLNCVYPEDRESITQGLSCTFKEKVGYDKEFRLLCPDGSIRWLMAKGQCFYDEAGNTVRMVGITMDITASKQAAEQIKASLVEKEVLLKEVHPRVKNNLQIISSLLNLQSDYVKNYQTLEILKVCQNRIDSIALIHEQLYQSQDLAQIDFAEYIENLATNLLTSYERDSDAIALKLNIDDIKLNIDTAIPCGLIINELISNSLKYAFIPGNSGEISISFHVKPDNHLQLNISDNGIGLPPDLDINNTDSLGLQLVTALTSQLGGTIEINRDIGTQFIIQFLINNL